MIATGAPALPRTGLTRQAAAFRLVWLHLICRRVPVALIALAVCGAVLRAALVWHWGPGSGHAALELPALIEVGTAAVIAVTAYSPFGEPERATGRWLPWLRLGTALGLTGAAIGLLATGAAGENLPDGTLAIVRNVAGATGIGLLLAAVIGGALAWVGPMAYLVIAEVALLQAWTSPWTWPARPPHDRGAAICAALVFAAGITITMVRGARDSVGD
ncbi:MAG TPA: hypothetical protein VF070_24485 [Streptosporangiaceae bacterium]